MCLSGLGNAEVLHSGVFGWPWDNAAWLDSDAVFVSNHKSLSFRQRLNDSHMNWRRLAGSFILQLASNEHRKHKASRKWGRLASILREEAAWRFVQFSWHVSYFSTLSSRHITKIITDITLLPFFLFLFFCLPTLDTQFESLEAPSQDQLVYIGIWQKAQPDTKISFQLTIKSILEAARILVP